MAERSSSSVTDVFELMSEVRSEVARRYERSELPPNGAEDLERTYGVVNSRELVDRAIQEMRRVPLTSDITAESQKRLVGPVVSASRRAIRGTIRWHTNGLLAQFRMLIDQVAQVGYALNDRLDAIERRFDEHLWQLDDIRAEIRALRDDVNRLATKT